MSKIITPKLVIPNNVTRRLFLKRAAMASLLGGLAPNLLTSRARAGTAVIMLSGSDERIQLSNACFARPFDIGTWTTIRVCCRIMGEFSASLTSVTPQLRIGLCSGSTNQIMDSSTTHYLGLHNTNATWTYVADTVDYLLSLSTGFTAAKRVGTTTTAAGDNFGHLHIHRASETAGNSHMLIVQITKGSPNYTLKAFHPNEGPFVNVPVADFLAQSVAVTPTWQRHYWSGAISVAVDEGANGTFDHVAFGWDQTTATMQFSDIAIVKMA